MLQLSGHLGGYPKQRRHLANRTVLAVQRDVALPMTLAPLPVSCKRKRERLTFLTPQGCPEQRRAADWTRSHRL